MVSLKGMIGMEKKAGFLRIREYIVDKVTAAGERPVRFPPVRELAKMFDVSHPTVLHALKGLIEDGILEPCRGGGAISRPKKNNPPRLIFGWTCGTGHQVFDDRYFFDLSSALVGELLHRDERFFAQHLYVEEPNHLQKLAAEAELSGLLLVAPWERILEFSARLRTQGMPVVAMNVRSSRPHPYPVSSAEVDLQWYMVENLLRLFREGRRKILLVSADNRAVESAAAVKSACVQADLSPDSVRILNNAPLNLMEDLTCLLESGERFDGVLFQHTPMGAFRKIAQTMDVEDDCRIIMGESALRKTMNYTGYVSCFDLAHPVEKLIDNLTEQMDHPSAPVISETISWKTFFYRGGKQCKE